MYWDAQFASVNSIRNVWKFLLKYWNLKATCFKVPKTLFVEHAYESTKLTKSYMSREKDGNRTIPSTFSLKSSQSLQFTVDGSLKLNSMELSKINKKNSIAWKQMSPAKQVLKKSFRWRHRLSVKHFKLKSKSIAFLLDLRRRSREKRLQIIVKISCFWWSGAT